MHNALPGGIGAAHAMTLDQTPDTYPPTPSELREAAQKAARAALVGQLLAELPGFSPVVQYAHVGPLLRRDADGVTVDVTVGGWQKAGRVGFSFAWPLDETDGPNGRRLYPSEYEKKDAGNPATEITVAESTPVARMAKQLHSRLLTPEGVALWQSMQDRATARRDYDALTRATVATVAAALGVSTTDYRGHPTTSLAVPDVENLHRVSISGSDVKLELMSLPVEDALAVIALLKARHPAKD
jgi:hypothetical protein